MLEDEDDEDKWLIIWLGAMALLRTVGDVLNKVDGCDTNGSRNQVGHTQYRLFKDHWGNDPMFKEFIKAERDLLIHEDKSKVSRLPTVSLVVFPAEVAFETTPDLFRPIVDGHFSGEDARDVYEMAIGWWSDQINLLRTELN